MKFLFNKRKKTQGKKSQEHYLQYREQARQVIVARVEYYAQKYGFTYKRIAIKNTSTRWGSCSSLRNLNFNYRLVFLDQELLDYIVVHELCHLRHMNHSKEYWEEVKKILPDYKESLRELKKIRLQKFIN